MSHQIVFLSHVIGISKSDDKIALPIQQVWLVIGIGIGLKAAKQGQKILNIRFRAIVSGVAGVIGPEADINMFNHFSGSCGIWKIWSGGFKPSSRDGASTQTEHNEKQNQCNKSYIHNKPSLKTKSGLNQNPQVCLVIVLGLKTDNIVSVYRMKGYYKIVPVDP